MSMPSCMRPQRKPNGLVTGPLTGQISPADDGVDDGPLLECCACAAWMRAVERRAGGLQRVDLLRLGALGGRELREVGELLLLRARESGRARRAARSGRARVCAVRAVITAASLWTVARTFFVFARAALTCAFAWETSVAIRRSCTPMSVMNATWSSASWTFARRGRRRASMPGRTRRCRRAAGSACASTRRTPPRGTSKRFVWSRKSAFSASRRFWCSARSASSVLSRSETSPTLLSSVRICDV